MASNRASGKRLKLSGITLVIAAGLLGLVLYLVFHNYQSAKKLQQVYFQSLAEEAQRQAATVDFFLAECRHDLVLLGESREISAYYQNIDLGMSPDYGLNLSLVGIKRVMQDLVSRRRVRENPIYERVVLLDGQGALLADAVDAGTANALPADAKHLLDPRQAVPAISFDPVGRRICWSLAIWHNGRYKGQLLAWMIPHSLLAQLRDPDLQKRHACFLAAKDVPLFPFPAEAPAQLPAQAFQFHPIAPADHLKVMGGGAAAVPFAVFRVPLKRSAALDLVAAFDLSGSSVTLSPLPLLLTMILLSLVIMGGGFFLHRFELQSVALQIRLEEDQARRSEVEEKNRLLLAEIQERRKAEAALSQSEQNYREIFNATKEGIIIHDADTGNILDVNQTMLEMYGYARAEMDQLSVGGLSANEPGYTEAEARQYLQAARADQPQMFVWAARRKNGERFWCEVALRRASISGQSRILAVVRDITERKHAEQQQQSLQQQLAQAQKMESVGRLAGGVAHDFNNLLTSILGNVELLHCDLPTSAAACRENLQEIRKAGERASELTRQLLAFSRKQVLQMRCFDLNQLIVGFGKMLRRLIGEHIDFVTVLTPDLDHVKADPAQMEQVIMNLAVNARDAMPRGGKLVLRTAHADVAAGAELYPGVDPGRYVLLEVCDTGCGMDAKMLANIFEPFFTTKAVGKGTGLGLAMVYGIVKQHGGYITVRSEPQRGTTFSIYLPRAMESVRSAEDDSQAQGIVPGTETILVVEDDPSVRQLTRNMLARNGYQVLVAESGAAALALVRQHGRIDILLTDVIMPHMSGREVYEAVTKLQPGVKVLFCSGYNDEVIAQYQILPDHYHFLQKPFTMQTLTAKLREILD